MMCGGKGKLDDSTPYLHIRAYINYIERADLIYPEEIPWFYNLVQSVIVHSYKRGKRIVPIVIIVSHLKDKDIQISGITTIGGPGTIYIMITPEYLGWLKQSRPHICLSKSVRALIEVVYHELYHFKHDRGKQNAEEKDIKSIFFLFRELLEERIEDNENIYYN